MNRRQRSLAFGPRKTATQTRATRTVEAIVEAAARILETLGFDGYTTNAIARRAGVSIGSLYQYFPNKTAITLALIERDSKALRLEVQEAASIEDWYVALDRMVGAAVHHQLRRPVLARLLDVEEARLRASAATPDAAETGEATAIHAAVQHLIARGAFNKPFDIETMARDVIAIAQGMTDMAGRLQEGDAEALQQRVSRAVLGYLLGTT